MTWKNQFAHEHSDVSVFLARNEVHTQVLEFLQRVDQRLGQASKPVMAQGPQLRLGALAFVEGGDAGVEGHALRQVGRFGGHRGLSKRSSFAKVLFGS